MRKQSKVTCAHCNSNFLKDNSEIVRNKKIGRSSYCSLKCARANRKPIVKENNCICAQCNKEFYRNASKREISKSGLQFCSRKCKDLAQRIGGIKEIQPYHYTDSLKEYRLLVEREIGIKECNRCKYKDFPEILQVHHKDRNRKNNELSNLEVLCPNCHSLEHIRGISIDG